MSNYDFLIVGAGLFGSVCARELADAGFRVLVIDRRKTIGGNCYTDEENGVIVHRYGAHIFHTSDKKIWDYVAGKIALESTPDFAPLANSRGEVFNLPFNMNTFARLFGVVHPAEARARIEEERKAIKGEPRNLEEQAISLVGTTVYERLIKGYTEKQWGKKCRDLPPEIIKRIPVRFTYDNSYYNDKYVGIPADGWTPLFTKLLDGIEVRLGVNYTDHREEYANIAEKTIYTGPIDEFFDYELGRLEYRSLRFETTYFNGDFQGCAVMNYTDSQPRYTRAIEHRHFDKSGKREYKSSVITLEYPAPFKEGAEPFYPVNDRRNMSLYEKYHDLAVQLPNYIFAGRLGAYKYVDMDDTIIDALELSSQIVKWREWAKKMR